MSSSKGWIGVDLDGTLAKYDGWRGVDHIGDPVPRMQARVKKWLEEGQEVRIFTARVGHRPAHEVLRARTVIDLWCKKHLGRELPVTCTKDLAMKELWDDRCKQVIPNTGVAVDEVVAAWEESYKDQQVNIEWLKLGPL